MGHCPKMVKISPDFTLSKILNQTGEKCWIKWIVFSCFIICRAGTHKMLVGMTNREDPDQTASEEAV